MRRKETVDWEVIRRKIRGMASEEERQQLERWAGRDFRKRKFIASAEKYYAAREFPVVDNRQTDRAWQRFEQSCRETKRKVYRRIVASTAAAVVLLALGVGGRLYWQSRQPEDVNTIVSGIQPGWNRACLILSDGRLMELGNRMPVRRIMDQQVDIRVDPAGLVYKPVEQTDRLVYNTVLVPHGGEYHLVLGDGSKVWLNAQSKLVYPVNFTGCERRVKLVGEAYFEVSHEQKPFVVETDGMEVRVLGTHFNVSAYEDEEVVKTTLVNGRVEVSSANQQKNILSPGQQAVWEKSKGEIRVREVNVSYYIQWKEGRFVFRDMALKDIMHVLSRWYSMEYEFISTGTEEITFYGSLNRYEHIEELLQQFEKTGKVKFTFKGNKIFIK